MHKVSMSHLFKNVILQAFVEINIHACKNIHYVLIFLQLKMAFFALLVLNTLPDGIISRQGNV